MGELPHGNCSNGLTAQISLALHLSSEREKGLNMKHPSAQSPVSQ